jgi:histidinol-phosphate aminotransferase
MKFLESVRKRLPDYPAYYEAPAGSLLRLDQNANLIGPPGALLQTPVDLTGLHLYPTRDNTALLDAASRAYGVQPESIVACNGSDEVLDVMIRTLVSPGGRVASPQPSYSMYPHLCRLSRAVYVPVPTDSDFQVSANSLLAAKPDLVLIASPNNPTGTVVEGAVVEQVLEAFDGPVIVDEAYAEFGETNLLPLLGRFENLLICRTLSKAAGLAGLRVGFGFANPAVAELLRRNKLPFSVNLLSERLAVRALASLEQTQPAVHLIQRERERVCQRLAQLGFGVVPSRANFVLTRPPIARDLLLEALKRNGILARVFPSDPALAPYIRFTIGRPQDNDRLMGALQEILRVEVKGR